MATREIAVAIVLDTQGRFLLQRRDNIPGIVHPGKVSLFGGHREPGETYLDCITREIQEELSYPVLPEDFEHLASLDELGEVVEGDTVRGEIFVLKDIPSDSVVVTEGSLMTVEADDLGHVEQDFTPVTRFAFRARRTDQTGSGMNPHPN
jgi:8-oxo-dGTP diphosphatase